MKIIFLAVYPNMLLVKKTMNEFELFTPKFQGREENESMIALNRLYSNSTFQTNASLYPDKIYNLGGRIVKAATVTYTPYAYIKTVVSVPSRRNVK